MIEKKALGPAEKRELFSYCHTNNRAGGHTESGLVKSDVSTTKTVLAEVKDVLERTNVKGQR